MNFQFSPLPKSHFQHLLSLPKDELIRNGATRMTATKHPGFPCRISLEDARVGEEVLLVNYQHLDLDTPFRSNYAIYLRPSGKQANPQVNEVPEMLRTRPLSLRAWGRDGMLVGAELTGGREVERAIAALFEIPETSFIHAHFAKPGCYAARIDRA